MIESNRNAKVKSFLNYIINKYNNHDYIELMSNLDETDIIDGGLVYKKTIKSKIAARNYLTSVNGFFKQNRVKNAIFEDREKYEKLKVDYEKIVVSDLTNKVNEMEIYSDDELNELDEMINLYFRKIKLIILLGLLIRQG